MCLKCTDQSISRNCEVVVVHTHRYADHMILALTCAHSNFVVTRNIHVVLDTDTCVTSSMLIRALFI